MVECDGDFTHCTDGCCYNVTIHCCNIICNNTHTYCILKSNDEELGINWFVIIVVALIIAVLYFLRKQCSFFRDCLDEACSRTRSACSCEDCNSDNCVKCISGAILCPCLFVMWLYSEWKQRTDTTNTGNTQEENTSSQVASSSSPPAVDYIDIVPPSTEPSAPPATLNQTHIDIPIYNGYPHSSSTDPDYDGSGIVQSRVVSPSDIGVSPPSYEEVIRNDPPSYADAHKYPIDGS